MIAVPVAPTLMKISCPVVIPPVFVLESSTVSFPITRKKLPPIVPRRYPASPIIWRPSPITLVPCISSTYWIPVPLHPYELCSRAGRQHSNDAGPGGGPMLIPMDTWAAYSDPPTVSIPAMIAALIKVLILTIILVGANPAYLGRLSEAPRKSPVGI